jgi:ubiquinol-cytochrome c reductase iron-sulfur subunit
MADSTQADGHDANRRDFLYVAATGMGGVGVAMVAWPFVDQMNPSKDVLALSSVEIDISKVEPGQMIKVSWRGKPIFVRRRTKEEIARAQKDDTADMKDQQSDKDRVQKAEWLILVGVCTHFGCIPLGNQGEFQGFFCPCHGSHYDISGRIRKGPAPKNLEVPKYVFLNDTTIRVG